MTAELITHSVVGGPIGSGASTTGTGVVFGIYTATCTENDDWVILSDFSEIKSIVCQSVSSGAYATEAVTVDTTTKNKVVFTAGGTDTLNLLVWGTPA